MKEVIHNRLANDNVNDIEENTNGDIWFATDDGISNFNSLRHLETYTENQPLP